MLRSVTPSSAVLCVGKAVTHAKIFPHSKPYQVVRMKVYCLECHEIPGGVSYVLLEWAVIKMAL